MAFVPVWPPGPGARSWPHGVPRAGFASAPDARRLLAASRAQAFPRSVRLTQPAQYRQVFAQARRLNDTGFTLLVRDNGGEGARLGLAISRKCARRAVDRQRIKRLVRESFRRNREQLVSVDIVVMCRPAVTDWDNQRIRASLDRFWARLSAACESP